ncbi:MAG: MFS transporter, partial [Salinarchaeum sp.]
SSGNYAIVYTAKIGGGIFAGSIAGALIATAGWTVTFLVAAGLAIAAGIGALLLRPPHYPDT